MQERFDKLQNGTTFNYYGREYIKTSSESARSVDGTHTITLGSNESSALVESSGSQLLKG